LKTIMKTMQYITKNPSEIKLQLFRFIDNMPENQLQGFYHLLISNAEEKTTDF